MSEIDVEQGFHRRSVAGSEVSVDGSVCFSDADDGSCYSQFYSTTGESYDDYNFSCMFDPEIGNPSSDSRRMSSLSEYSVEVVEVVNRVSEIKVHLGKIERDCRICHLGLESNSHESGVLMELGCSCKDDLAAAHKHCAETWFKIRGNKICEICNSIARNVVGANESEPTEHSVEISTVTTTAPVSAAPMPPAETRSFWHGHRFLNFLLACMVFAFVISWLFHFNVPS